MTNFQKITFTCYLCVILMQMAFGIFYTFRDEFMPYHAEALGVSWEQLELGYQVLIVALMRVLGGAWICASVALLLILWFPFRRGENWAWWAVPIIGAGLGAANLRALLHLWEYSSAEPPIMMTIIGMFALAIGLLCSLEEKEHGERAAAHERVDEQTAS